MNTRLKVALARSFSRLTQTQRYVRTFCFIYSVTKSEEFFFQDENDGRNKMMLPLGI